MKIKLTKQQEEFLLNGKIINLSNKDKWIYFPYWFKATTEQGVYEEFTFDQLPTGLQKYIENERNKK